MPASYLKRFDRRERIPLDGEPEESWWMNLAGVPWSTLAVASTSRRDGLIANAVLVATGVVVGFFVLIVSGGCTTLLTDGVCSALPMGENMDSISIAVAMGALWATLAVVEVGADTISESRGSARSVDNNELEDVAPNSRFRQEMVSDFWLVHCLIAVSAVTLACLMFARCVTRSVIDPAVSSGADFVALFMFVGVAIAALAYQDRFSRLPFMREPVREERERRIVEAAVFIQRHHGERTQSWPVALFHAVSVFPMLCVAAAAVHFGGRNLDVRGSDAESEVVLRLVSLAILLLVLSAWTVNRRWSYAWRAGARNEFGLQWNRSVGDIAGVLLIGAFLVFFVLLELFVSAKFFESQNSEEQTLLACVGASAGCIAVFFVVLEGCSAIADRLGVRSLNRARRRARRTLKISAKEYRIFYPNGRCA